MKQNSIFSMRMPIATSFQLTCLCRVDLGRVRLVCGVQHRRYGARCVQSTFSDMRHGQSCGTLSSCPSTDLDCHPWSIVPGCPENLVAMDWIALEIEIVVAIAVDYFLNVTTGGCNDADKNG